MEANDALMLLRQEDDPAALELLIKIYTPYVFSVLRRKLGAMAQPEDIEELASNVFFRSGSTENAFVQITRGPGSRRSRQTKPKAGCGSSISIQSVRSLS